MQHNELPARRTQETIINKNIILNHCIVAQGVHTAGLGYLGWSMIGHIKVPWSQ